MYNLGARKHLTVGLQNCLETAFSCTLTSKSFSPNVDAFLEEISLTSESKWDIKVIKCSNITTYNGRENSGMRESRQ